MLEWARASPEMKLLSSLHARKTNAGPYSLGMAARLTGVCEPNFSTFSSGKLSTISGVLRASRTGASLHPPPAVLQCMRERRNLSGEVWGGPQSCACRQRLALPAGAA